MRIGIDARLWNESGVGRYIRNLLKQLQVLDKKNEYVLFVLSKDYDEVKSEIPSPKFQLVKSDIRWHTLQEQFEMPTVLKNENLDLVHFPYFSVPIFYSGPYVVTIHDLILHHFPTGEASTLPFFLYKIKLFGYQYVIKHAAQKAKKVITVSNATKDEIIDHLSINPQNVIVTHEGVDETLQGRDVGKPKIKNTAYFLYVGNAYPHKNLDRTLKAFREMRTLNEHNKEKMDVSFVLVGKEDYFYKKLKEKMKEEKMDENVDFYGFATDKELHALYKNAMALVASSLMEGFGLPVLEAMEGKCLVLASDIPVFREITGNNALFFDPQNEEDIKAKLERVFFADKKEFEPIISQAEKKSKEYNWNNLAKDTLSVYESCISIRPSQ